MKLHHYFLIFLLFSCETKHEKGIVQVTEIKFSNSIEVAYKEIDTDLLLSHPNTILLSDSCLIILDSRGHDFYYHVINRISGKLELEFGQKGNGPQDILITSSNPLYNDKKNEVQFFDSNKKQLCYYNLSDNSFNSINIRDMSQKNNLFLLEFLDIDNYYLGAGKNGLLDDFRFVLFDKSLELINKMENYPVFDNDLEKNKKINEKVFNISFLKTSPDKKHLLFASYETNLLEIFSLEELPEKINKIKSLLLTKPMKNENENIYGFEDVYPTNSYIYALHNGKTAAENPYLSKSVKVFDWEGNPIIEYRTDVDMRCLAVDETGKAIYAVAYTDDKGFFLIQLNIP